MKIKDLIKKELARQKKVINLIPSENYPSKDVLAALGSQLTSKYAEGYPGKRYYPGNEINDRIEIETQNLARRVFGLSKGWQVNVQPYSGTPANIAVYLALLKPGDILMGMRLNEGGHLSHGHRVNFSGMFYKVIQYGLNKNGFIDYKEIEKLAKKHRPKIIVSGTTAYPRKIDFKKFGQIAKKVGAYHLADISHIAGLVAAKLHQSPFLYADVVMTTTHKTLRGPRGAVIISKKLKVKSKNGREELLSDLIDKAVFPEIQGGPHLNVIAAMGVCFEEALKPDFKSYIKQVVKNARVLAGELKKHGFNLVSGGTDNHLILVDLKNKNISGREAQDRLEKAGIIANRNTVPGDESPFKPSGLRLGTPAQTTRGAKEKDMVRIAEKIAQVLG
ncbi:MAG: serine hydroxymethyltransferase [Patescibacteria group bacterium]